MSLFLWNIERNVAMVCWFCFTSTYSTKNWKLLSNAKWCLPCYIKFSRVVHLWIMQSTNSEPHPRNASFSYAIKWFVLSFNTSRCKQWSFGRCFDCLLYFSVSHFNCFNVKSYIYLWMAKENNIVRSMVKCNSATDCEGPYYSLRACRL